MRESWKEDVTRQRRHGSESLFLQSPEKDVITNASVGMKVYNLGVTQAPNQPTGVVTPNPGS